MKVWENYYSNRFFEIRAFSCFLFRTLRKARVFFAKRNLNRFLFLNFYDTFKEQLKSARIRNAFWKNIIAGLFLFFFFSSFLSLFESLDILCKSSYTSFESTLVLYTFLKPLNKKKNESNNLTHDWLSLYLWKWW